jgi:glycosyltransferase involved in cell wall biosynthesis
LPAKVRHVDLGVATNPRILSLVYNAADVFLMLSKQDNLPNTVLEAMACGIPVAAFETGGIPDMVRHDDNGLLCQQGDVAGLASMLNRCFDNPAMFRRMGENARRRAQEEFSLALQAQRYTELYRELLDGGVEPARNPVSPP